MRLLLFLSKLAFVCNLFFLLSAVLHWKNFIGDETIASTIIIIGYFLAVFVFSPLVNIICLTVWSIRRKIFDVLPKWLVLMNFIFLLLQITYIIFILNDKRHS